MALPGAGPSVCRLCRQHVDPLPLVKGLLSQKGDELIMEEVGRGDFWYSRTCMCVFHGKCVDGGQGHTTSCPIHKTHVLFHVSENICVYDGCRSLATKKELVPLCSRHWMPVVNRIVAGVINGSNGRDTKCITIRKLYTHMCTTTSLVPESLQTWIRELGSSLLGDISNVGNIITYVHPLVKTIWRMTMAIILNNATFWCELDQSAHLCVWLSPHWMESVLIKEKPRIITYAEAFNVIVNLIRKRKRIEPDLDSTKDGLLLPLVPSKRAQRQMLAWFKTNVSTGKLGFICQVDANSFRKRTPLNCYSVSNLLRCLISAGAKGIRISDLMPEDVEMPTHIKTLLSTGTIFIANRRVYSTSFTKQLPDDLYHRFRSTGLQ